MTAHKIITPDGIALYAESAGAGPRTLVIGAACFLAEEFMPLTDDFRLIFFDQRNRGRSDQVPPEKIGLDYEIADIEVVRHHFGLERMNLLGWSYLGAMVALYAARFPQHVARLVMLSPIAPRQNPEFDSEWQRRAEARTNQDGLRHLEMLREHGLPESAPEQFCRENAAVYRPRSFGNPAALARMTSDPCRFPNEQPDRVAQHFRHLYSTFGTWDWRETASAVTCPTLLLHGDSDLIPLAAAEEWAAALPRVEFIKVAGAGHWVWLEAPELFFPALRQFLAR